VARAIEQVDRVDGMVAWGVTGREPSRVPWAQVEPPE